MSGTSATANLLAWYAHDAVNRGATAGFWYQLTLTYWRLHVIGGAVIVFAGAWLAREASPGHEPAA